MSKIGDFFKKRLGTAANRDPRVTWSGTFGTEAARKKQKERLSSSAKIDAELARNKKDRDALNKPKASPPSRSDELPRSVKPIPPAPPKAERPDKVKAAPKATAPKVDRMKDFMTGFEGNAVARRINERAATMNEVARAKSGDDALERIRQRAQSLAKSRSAEDDKRRAEKVDMAKNYKKGGSIDGCAVKGKTKGRYI